MSDFGTEDYYVAAVRARILSRSPNQTIVDITHHVKPFDIMQASNILMHTFNEFPKGTVHLVAIDSAKEKTEPIAIRLEDHYFVGFNTGLFSLISDKKPNFKCRLWSTSEGTFPAKDILADAALKLAQGESMDNLGDPLDNFKELFNRKLKLTKKEIVGNIIHIDRYGNLITNIQRKDFDEIMGINGENSTFRVFFGREVFELIHVDFTDVDSGDCFLLFNSTGNLEIGINKGNASRLLGLKVDAPVHIEFNSN
jgi:hypothetical protein